MRRKTLTYARPPQSPSTAMSRKHAPIAYVPKIELKIECVLSTIAISKTKAWAIEGSGISCGGSGGTLKITLLEREKKTNVYKDP